MGGPQRIVVLVQRAPVELGQCPLVAREVRGNPVHQDADAGLVQPVHQVLEVVRGAEARRRGVEAGDLVAPGAAEGVLGDRHQLHMGEARLRDVRGELLGQLPVRQAGTPGGQVDLVHREGRLVDGGVAAVGHPLCVAPLVVRGVHDRGRGGRDLRAAGQRVGAQGARAVRAGDLELVQLALADARNEQLPHPRGAERAHRVPGRVPEVEAPRDPHAPRVRRPHRETRAGHALVGQDVRAEHPPQLLVPALADQVQVQLAERGQEAVGVLGLVDGAVVGHEQPVGGDLGEREEPGEEAVPVVVQLGPQICADHGDRLRVRAEGPEGDAAGDRVAAEDGVRIVVGAVAQTLTVRGRHGRGDGDPLSRHRPGRRPGRLAGRLRLRLRPPWGLLCRHLPGGGLLPGRGVFPGGGLLLGRSLLPGCGVLLDRGVLLGRGFLLGLGRHELASWSGRERRRTALSGTGSQSGRWRAS